MHILRPSPIALLLSLLLTACATTSDAPTSLEEVKNSEWHYKMASGYFESHEIPRAIRELTISIEKDPNNADAHYLLGFIYLGREDYVKSYEHFDRAVKSRANFYSAINNRGTALLALERWDEAIKDFEQLVEQPLYATPELAYNNLGWAHYNLKDYQNALNNYRMAIFLKPSFCLAYNNQGLANEALQWIDAAAESYQIANEKCGDTYAEPHFHLGKIYAQNGDPRALAEFQACNDINPTSNLARRCREYLKSLSGYP